MTIVVVIYYTMDTIVKNNQTTSKFHSEKLIPINYTSSKLSYLIL